ARRHQKLRAFGKRFPPMVFEGARRALQTLFDFVLIEGRELLKLFARSRIDRGDGHCRSYCGASFELANQKTRVEGTALSRLGVRDTTARIPRRIYSRRPFGIKARSSKSKTVCTSSARSAAG